jgi:hypothetical protein
MAKLERDRIETGGGDHGAGARAAGAADRYCAVCGTPVKADGPSIERFGEPFCSEPHATEFVDQVRAVRVQEVASAPAAAPACALGSGAPGSWKGSLGKALCWGAPVLIVAALVLGGTGALAGVAGAALPYLAALACPLGMYFMMRSMSKMGHDDNSGDKGGQK